MVGSMDWGSDRSFHGNHVTRKRLIGEDGIYNQSGNGQALALEGRVALQVNLLENNSSANNGEKVLTTPQKVQPPKRQRKVGEEKDMEGLVGSATSEMEDRREQ